MCREDYLNLVSIVRAHGLHGSPRVSLAALRYAHGRPLLAVLSLRLRLQLPHTDCVMQRVWHLQPAGSHEQHGAAR